MNTETAAELDLYQEVVMDHKRAPRHFGTLPAPTHQARGQNPQCGDDLQVAMVMDHGKVKDIRFSGQGCAICIASASMMTEAVLGQDAALAQQLHARFRAVLTGQMEPEGAHLGKLVSLAGVRRYPGRIKCALLGWHALMHALGTEGDTSNATPEAAS
ncbi:iron-sulfur cluster assembly scaffold protein [Hydrogenophaga crassostreae]|uniref:Iron-sulfur cluster assembly scaffold protein n=1 Tax=Hydrogenophaga crassostreae TaxID=1763535 RepID=A0A167IT62_9BURK|nr:SUF system NifU family Fe-S cluster assembly protein [Hydrogenophaga crassostreae]AOW14421.1 SUF system NifU family Fe-S cluster assembly protein [Hydrogenophaga crassostreae]OAD43554.1 iron-sulfur cluster assembly scaffold protein [Hydrogenophaga crassostreae]